MGRAGTVAPKDVVPFLRAVMEPRKLTLAEARVIADQQADLLRQMVESPGPAGPLDVIFKLPGMHVEFRPDAPVAGLSWPTAPDRWRIVISGRIPWGERRFSLLHEFKHVLDDPFITEVYGNLATEKHQRLAERVCEHFAGCFLMPSEWITRDWNNGEQNVADLAERYGVSQRAVRERLRCLGLSRRQRPQRRITRGAGEQGGGSDG
jgi:hypothetical protein